MLKVFSKSRAPLLCLGLLISSNVVLAGFSEDPDCKAVSDGARSSADRVLSRIDQRTQATGAAISSAKSCVDQIAAQANRAISDFGGGMGAIGQMAVGMLAQQGCQIIGNAQNQVMQQTVGQLPSSAQPAAAAAIGNVTSGGASGSSSTANPSIWRRISNLF